MVTLLDYLRKNTVLDTELKSLIWHMNIGKLPVDKIMELCEIRGEYNFQKCEELVKKIRSCNMGHDGADEDLYMKLIKEGFKDRNYHCSKNGKSSSEEDTTDLYDEYVDEVNDLINDNKSLRLNKNDRNI